MKHGVLIDLGFKGQFWILIQGTHGLLAYRGIKGGTTNFEDPANYSTSISLDVIKPEGIKEHADAHAFTAASLWQMLK